MNPRFHSVLPHIAWPAPLSPSASSRLAMIYQLEQSQWWTPQALQRAQFEQLKNLLPYAVAHVPYYRQVLAGWGTADAVTPERWPQVPILTRAALRAAGADLHSRAVPREHGAVHQDQTSGSTGQMVHFLSTDLNAFFWKAFALREHFWHRRDFSQKLMSIRYVKEDAAKAAGGLHADAWGGPTEGVVRTGPAALYHIAGSIEFFAARVLAERPGYVLSHASVLRGLVEHFERSGQRPPGLLELRSIGESIDDDQRDHCRRVLGVPLVDAYTCQEAGYLASQCPDHDHYHVQSENVLLEVVDGEGRACAPGEIGRVLVTCLHNFAMPLIRYELGDLAEVGPACPCGRGLPVLRRVMGRYRNLVQLPSGVRRWPRMGFEYLDAIGPIELIQLVQRSLQDVHVRLVVRSPLTAAQTAALTAHIHTSLGHPFNLSFEEVAEIRSPVNGKIEHFISELPPPLRW